MAQNSVSESVTPMGMSLRPDGRSSGFLSIPAVLPPEPCHLEEESADEKPPQRSLWCVGIDALPRLPSVASQSGEPGCLVWQLGPWPAAAPGACLRGCCLICCHHFVSLLLSGSRKLGGHSGPHPSGSCCARGGCLPKGVSGELHAHRLWHRYLPFPHLFGFTAFLGCFLFVPGCSGDP